MIKQELYNEIQKYIELNSSIEESTYSIKLDACICKQELVVEPEASFSETLLQYIKDKKLNDSDVYNRANIDRRLFSKIRNNKDYKPSKPTILALCIALKLDIDKTEDLLERAGFALSHSDKADIIVRFFIEEKEDYTLFDVDEALISFDLKPISNY